MKKKFFTFLLAICFIIPCAFLFIACDNDNDPQDTFLGYAIYMHGTKTNLFECVSGETAITPNDISIKSLWSDESKNANVPLSDFDVSVTWTDENYLEHTTLPDFWTNGTGDTTNDYATVYAFMLTLKSDPSDTTIFDVIVKTKTASNCSVRIFDGSEYTASTQMVWGYNLREPDPAKRYKLDIENLDTEYNKHDRIQWAFVEKSVYDSLTTKEQKQDCIYNKLSPNMEYIPTDIGTGTYYVFAQVPDCNNISYGEDRDGIIYNPATITIVPVEIERVKLAHEYDYKDAVVKYDVSYGCESLVISSEIKNIEKPYIDYTFYVFKNNAWVNVFEQGVTDTAIKVNAVKDNNSYKWVVLKDIQTSNTEWVYVNEDGTKSNTVVTDNSKIELIDYTQLDYYIQNSEITVPIYYMIAETYISHMYYDCSNMYETSLTIKKALYDYYPNIKAGEDSHVPTKDNCFEITYGEMVRLNDHHVVYDPASIIIGAYDLSTYEYTLVGCDDTDFTNGTREAYITTGNPNVAWKVSEGKYNSVPIKILYQINKAEIAKPEYKEVEGKTNLSTVIEVLYDASSDSYSLSTFLTIDNIVNNDENFSETWINMYSYALTENDYLLSQSALIEKVKEEGELLRNHDRFARYDDNVIGKTFIVMYELSNTTNLIWEDGTSDPVIFKVQIVDSIT